MNKDTALGAIVVLGLVMAMFLYNRHKIREYQDELAEQQQQRTDFIEDSIRRAPAKGLTPIESVQATAAASNEQAITDPQTSGSNTQSASVQADSLKQSAQEAQQFAQFGSFSNSASGTKQTEVLKNDRIKIRFSNQGGRPISANLFDYKTWDQRPLVLFDSSNLELYNMLPLNNNRKLNTDEHFFSSSRTDSSISYTLKSSNGAVITQTWTLGAASYQLGYRLEMLGMENDIPSNLTFLELNWNSKMRQLEKDLSLERRYSGLYYKTDGESVDHLNLNKTEEEEISGPIEWISAKQQFFNITLVGGEGFSSAKLNSIQDGDDDSYVKDYKARMILPFRPDASANTYEMSLFIGPNDFPTLKKLGQEREDIIQLAPDFFLFGWFDIVTKGIILPVFHFLERFVSSYGIIILILTILIKLALSPLTYKSYKYQVVMKVLKPELDALKEKHKDDQQKFGTEQWKLYQKAGVNPFSGCLPMLLQMPILISMYYFFPSSLELRQEAFLWANDLSTYDSVISWATPILGFSHISLFTVLMTVASLLYAVSNMQTQAAGNEAMKYMPYIFPFFLFFIFNSFPAALSYYYFLFNIGSFLQQYGIKKFMIDEEKIHKEIQENKKKPSKKTGLQKKLEELQKSQQMQSKATKKGK